jgi:tRNA modification GTPase
LRQPRQARLTRLQGLDGEVLDSALALWFPAPGSFTGEDCVELHVHGGRAVVDAVSEALVGLGLRPAEPGEFSRRAFAAGKLDLAQAEAVADLVDAETEGQRRQALQQLNGALSQRYGAWRATLVGLLARLEAAIDFPDEDLPEDVTAAVLADIKALRSELAGALKDGARGERVRNGYRVALIGAPNAGKSTLFNALLGRDAAIVTPIAGTTRDVLEAPLVIAGQAVVLADTAGLRDSTDLIEAEGVRRAEAWAQSADLRLWVTAEDEPPPTGFQLGDLIVLSKSDDRQPAPREGLPVSALTGTGVEALRSQLRARVLLGTQGSDFPAVTRARHAAGLAEAIAALDRSMQSFSSGAELAVEDLRLAAGALARVTGSIGVEQVLDEVFSSFCIGK